MSGFKAIKMGLDIYVGSLSRYLSSNWATVAQQAKGIPAQISSQGKAPTAAAAHQAVVRWRKELSNTLGVRLEWNEDASAPYHTVKPGWDAQMALVIWAAYAEHPRQRRPAHFTPGEDLDPLVKSAMQQPHLFHSLLLNVELWLPTQQSAVYWVEWPLGLRRCHGGSVQRLNDELQLLNHKTWGATPSEVHTWLGNPPSRDNLDSWARFGFAMLSSMVLKAAEHRLPMLLNY